MVFSSLIFLCGFLPLTIVIYRLLPPRWRNLFLLIMSLLFYAWGEPKYLLLMAISILINYMGGLFIRAAQRKEPNNPQGGKRALILTCVLNLGLLGVFKYTDFLIGTFNSLTGAGISLLKIALPIGISFYTFQAMSYVIDVYRRTVRVQRNLIHFAMYVTLFPQLIAGPIVRYADIADQMQGRDAGVDAFWAGIVRFSIGLAKKALLANQAGKLWEEISGSSAFEAGTLSAATAWLGAIAFTFQIYFDFSGYSDMAIGLGQMFGFRFNENFCYPYLADSVTDFWRRWHISLSTWFREYVYIPLGGNRKGKARQICNLFIVWALTGLWHGAGWNFLCWGLYFFALLVLEKTFLLKVLQKLPALLRHLYALLCIVLGWVLFAIEDFSALGAYAVSLFGGHGGINEQTRYLLSSYAILLLLMCIASTSLPARLGHALCRKATQQNDASAVPTLLEGAWCAVLLIFSVSAIVADSYNPFLYFRF